MTINASQVIAEVLIQSTAAPPHASQVIAEALIQSVSESSRASQVIAEALIQLLSRELRASQILAEAILWNHPVTTPPIYPTLIGLGFSVIKRPIFYDARAVSGSGWQIGVGYADQPTWEWDLTYDVLADATGSDLKKLLGFYLGMRGDLVRFLFLDPDDNSVTAQYTGTGDGATVLFTLQRTYGTDGAGTENIGYLNIVPAFNVYKNAVLQSSGTYDILTATPGQQEVRFHTAPAAAVTITVDMSYYYYVHFKDPTNDFEKFADKLWRLGKVTLESLRG
jgi:hypothetical protein